MMLNRRKPVIAVLLWALALGVSGAQQAPRKTTPGTVRTSVTGNHARKPVRTLTADDGLSVIAAALDSKGRLRAEHDCSHLVHAIYERAGFPYAYASSDDLYDGVEGFQRVPKPQPGDLVVWQGHAGIVVRPSRHIFFSFKTAGPATDDYTAPYWVGRGRPRFYRYVKNDPCPGCTSVSALRRTQAVK
jgi:hypothetical protein